MKMLKITGCTDPHLWYACRVGQTVPYLGQWPECYRSREPSGFTNIVHFKDAEVVGVEDGKTGSPNADS